MRTIIVCGGEEKQRSEEIRRIMSQYVNVVTFEANPDIYFLTCETSVGIEQVRQLENQLLLKPYQEQYKIAVVEQAEKLTLAAQNALLKTLEEPPKDTIIILGCPNIRLLIPTIVSRCQVVKVQPLPSQNEPASIKDEQLNDQILQSKIGERLIIANEYGRNKDDALQFLNQQLIVNRNRLRKFRDPKLTRCLHKIQEAIVLINKNINPSLVIGELLLSY